MAAIPSDKISKQLNKLKLQQWVSSVLLFWYQGVITMEEVRVTLTLWRLASLHDIQLVPDREHPVLGLKSTVFDRSTCECLFIVGQ